MMGIAIVLGVLGSLDLREWRATLEVAEARVRRLTEAADAALPSQLDRTIDRTQGELQQLRRQLTHVPIERRELEGPREFHPDWGWLDVRISELAKVRSPASLAEELRFIEARLALWRIEAEWLDRWPPMQSSSEARSHAERILASEEFDLGRPSSSRGGWDGRLEGFRRFFRSLFSLLRPSSGRIRSAWAQLLVSVLTTAALLFLGIVVLRSIGRGIRLRSVRAAATGVAKPPQLLKAADRARRSQRPADAIALYFRMVIASLAWRGFVTPRASATCDDYSRMLEESAPGLKASFESLRAEFEAVAYGDRVVQLEEVGAFRDRAMEIVREGKTR
ncbi:MAG: hypothetical protein RL885_33280 [Planctomycetota bacterium]